MDIAPAYPIYNQGYNPLTIRGMNQQVGAGFDVVFPQLRQLGLQSRCSGPSHNSSQKQRGAKAEHGCPVHPTGTKTSAKGYLNKMPNRMSEYMPDTMSEYMSDRMPDIMSECMSGRPERMPDIFSQKDMPAMPSLVGGDHLRTLGLRSLGKKNWNPGWLGVKRKDTCINPHDTSESFSMNHHHIQS